MATKLMIYPSVRSKHVTDKNMKLIYYSLIVISVFMVLTSYYMFSFLHAIKLVLMIVLSIIATIETEILFYTHDKKIDRATAKELIVKSYPKVTGLIYVLLIPLGTPLWLVVLGAILATLIGKLLFGGFHHMVFHTSLVGVMLVTYGWTGLAVSADFVTSYDNYLLQLIFDNAFFNNTLSIGSLFDPATYSSAISLIGTPEMYSFNDVFLGIVPGIIGSGLVLVLIAIFLVYKKAINWITPTALIGSFLLTAHIVGLVQGEDIMYPIYHLFTGAFLFVAIFVTTDPITTPIPTAGKIVFGVVAGALTVLIRIGGEYNEGVFFAVLFMSMLTPMLNVELGKKKKVKKAPKKEGA